MSVTVHNARKAIGVWLLFSWPALWLARVGSELTRRQVDHWWPWQEDQDNV